ncbi:MAG: hypothetical protein WBP12_02375 [Candidatus Saccharimonas sp.]
MDTSSLVAIAKRNWDPNRRLTQEEVNRWINLCGSPEYLAVLHPYELHGHICVPMDGSYTLPPVAIGREIHRQGYDQYFSDQTLFARDEAERRILSIDTDATQLPGTRGVAWMCYERNRPCRNEDDLYGLMYELHPSIHEHLSGWRALPVSKLFVPTDRPSPLSEWGLDRLDTLERSGASIVEVSGLSVRSTAPHKGFVFHEIMRRILHQAVVVQANGGPEKVLVFAIVRDTRNGIRTRMGKENFVTIGNTFTPPGKDIDEQVTLVPSMVELSSFFDRMVISYRNACKSGRATKVPAEGVRFYTRGLAWQYLSQYPEVIELLNELDHTTPAPQPRTAENGWHDACYANVNCPTCSS